jgi:hypothetical protein
MNIEEDGFMARAGSLFCAAAVLLAGAGVAAAQTGPGGTDGLAGPGGDRQVAPGLIRRGPGGAADGPRSLAEPGAAAEGEEGGGAGLIRRGRRPGRADGADLPDGDGVVSAEERARLRALRFGLFDLEDDEIDREELAEAIDARVRALRAARFARLDRDGDGTIGEAEYLRAMRRRSELGAARILEGFDLDRNGRVTREEFEAAARQFFVRFDFNGDGAIELDDLAEGRR